MTKRVVVASGYFNPLHYGHVSYLQKAKDAGTTLIVIVNSDKQAALTPWHDHGVRRQPARERVKVIRSLACVDAAVEAIDTDESVAATLRLLHPDAFANGGKRKATDQEAAVCRELGIEMIEGLGVELLMLTPYTQHYDWGKPKAQSIVATLGRAKDAPGAESKPFAELWMGDHPSGPSVVRCGLQRSSSPLQSVLRRTPSMLGSKLADQAQLPFLLKVLSIHKALSIQAHPDRELAARLHREKPDVYKDANHKPEIAIALSDDFQALCGFRPVEELTQLVEAVPELRSLIGEEAAEALEASLGNPVREGIALKMAYCNLMHSGDEVVGENLQRLLARFESTPEGQLPQLEESLRELIQRLHGQFGEDIGIFSVFFLNFVHMKVGECLYMAQNTPHAYLSGDIVECMACSDNVVRGGLTPKFRDIEVLCEMLDYVGAPPARIKPSELDSGVLLYADPAIEEFQVTHVKLSAGAERRICFSSRGPAMAFTCEGQGSVKISGKTEVLEPGVVFMLAAAAEALIVATADLSVFAACCPLEYFKN